jgi:predicted acetyltransferase
VEKLKHVKPTKDYELQAIDYINEFYKYNSEINGVGGLHRFLNDYEGWLLKLEEDRNRVPSEEKVPAETFFLVRENDNKIVGMINIRLTLNERLKKFGGYIGYSIRPTERQKGYNKINLYLGLLCCQKHGIKEVLMDCDKENPASVKTMISLGGKLVREYFDDENSHCIVQDYIIDVNKAIEDNKQKYESLITNENYKTR